MSKIYNCKARLPVLSKRKQPSPPKNVEEPDLEPLKSLFGMKADAPDKEKNHIYFYGDVTQDSCLSLNRQINDLNKELLKYAIEFDCDPPNIFLHINSPGGDLLSAFSTVDTIRHSRVPIVSIVEGSAASAATIISMVCHKRYITENSFMLIHQLSSGCSGKYEELKDDFENDTKFMDLLYDLYNRYTTMSDKEIKQILTRDLWLTSKECLERGLVDQYWVPNTRVYIQRLFEEKSEKEENVEKDDKKSSKRYRKSK